VKILLIGNYEPDAQESMQRYTELLRHGLSAAGHEVTIAAPRPVLNAARRSATGLWKWIGYLDKYVLGPPALARAARHADIIHVCDHSNSVYVPRRSPVPYVVTCHDLLAVRGALGDDTDCPATFTGRQLQKHILGGLRRARALACVSSATMHDAQRLLSGYPGEIVLTPNALNHPYRVLDERVARERIAAVPALRDGRPYVLNIGSNLRRKNRECALRTLAGIASSWNGRLLFAGQPLTAQLRQLALQLQVADRIVEVVKPSNDLLEALYNRALALLFPSRFEGFGWPIIEAQACGCPVLCSDREPFPEVAGGAAMMCDADDHDGFGRAILALEAGGPREELRRRGLQNAGRYGESALIERLVSLYRQVAVAA